MQDINPVKKSLPVSEDTHSDAEDLRQELGIGEATEDISLKRERMNFSSLYTPESRRNVVDPNLAKYAPKQNKYGSLDRPKSFFWLYFLLGTGLLAVAFFVLTFYFNSAKVEITPVRKTLTLQNQEINLDMSNNGIQSVTASSTKSTDVPRRGTVDAKTKASGTIIITNKYDKTPQKLITNTRFEAANGKIYRIADSVTVPGMTGSTPGTVEAVVYADSIGSDYNIDSTTFTIPGFKGTPRYTTFTAATKTKITGGASGTQSAVADQDIADADAKLNQEIAQDIDIQVDALKKQNSESVIISEQSLNETNNKSALLTDSKLPYTKSTSKVLYIVPNQAVLSELLKNTDATLTIENLSDLDFTIATSTQTSTTTSAMTLKTILVTGTANIISNLDDAKIKDALKGKPKSSFLITMADFAGIDKALPKLTPFWSWKFPQDVNKIKIEIVK